MFALKSIAKSLRQGGATLQGLHASTMHIRARGLCSSTATLGVDSLLYTESKEWCEIFDTQGQQTAVVAIGLSDEALDEFGDPERIEVMAAAGQEMAKGDKIANIQWEGFMRTASDELYHAVWENVSGNRGIELPFAARIVQYNNQFLENPGSLISPEEDGKSWLVKVEVQGDDLEALRSMLMSRQEYTAWLSQTAD